MSIDFSIIEIFTTEEARYRKKALHKVVIDYIRELKIGARCTVMKGIEAYYENGEFVTQDILTISYNMPIKIEILLPSPELDPVLAGLDEMVTEGIVAVRPLEVRCHKIRKYLIPKHIRVRDVMTLAPKKLPASAPVGEAVKLLLSSIFTGVPVVDSANRPVGIITQTDLIYRAAMPVRLGILPESDRDKLDAFLVTLSDRKAEEIMTQPAISVMADDMLAMAIERMLAKGVKRLVVVDQSGELVGILSRIDIFQAIMRESPDWQTFEQRKIVLSDLKYVSDIMRRDTFAVSPDTSVEDVIHSIDINDLQCVAVVSANGEFKGLISDRDLLGVFLEHRISVWDYLASKISFHDKRPGHATFAKKLREKSAAEVMKTDLITVLEETTIDEAITLMIRKRIKRLPVLDKNRKFKGLINRESLLRAAFKNT